MKVLSGRLICSGRMFRLNEWRAMMPYYRNYRSNKKMTNFKNVNGLAVKSKVRGGSLTANHNQTLSR
jgi:hypothetical protein